MLSIVLPTKKKEIKVFNFLMLRLVFSEIKLFNKIYKKRIWLKSYFLI